MTSHKQPLGYTDEGRALPSARAAPATQRSPQAVSGKAGITNAFTPGPWGIEQTRDMLWVGPMRPDGHKVEDVVVGLNIDSELTATAALRQLHNARLIAAAPELLEVARDAIEIITLYVEPQAMGAVSQDGKQWPLRDEYLDNIRAVVAKATGGAA